MRAIRVVAFNTIKEILRDRILYGLLVFAVLLVVVSMLLGGLSFAEQERVILDLGLVAVELGCGMLAIFVGSSLVSREIEKQTVLLLISKPVKRSQFLLGKFCGLGLVIVLVDLLVAGFLALICHNFQATHWSQFAAAQFGIILESSLLLAVTIFFGIFCKPIMTVTFSLSAWLVGHGLNDLNYFSGKSSSPVMREGGLFLSRVLPNFDFFNFKEAVVYGDVIAASQIERAVLLWVCWFIIFLLSSIWIFQRRDFI